MSFDKPSIAGHRLTDKFLARANLHGPRAIDYPISSFTTWRSGPSVVRTLTQHGYYTVVQLEKIILRIGDAIEVIFTYEGLTAA